mmetsp:Transcript_52667/g.111877  ORF Transcript_52667/g.111877 Transcript_52667/m.111877 type:complete len:94 (+) Transcript_52667:61-342(+)
MKRTLSMTWILQAATDSEISKKIQNASLRSQSFIESITSTFSAACENFHFALFCLVLPLAFREINFVFSSKQFKSDGQEKLNHTFFRSTLRVS